MKLYRYIPFESFVELIETKKLIFVNPLAAWEDTYEGPLLRNLKTEEGKKIVLDLISKKGGFTALDPIPYMVKCLRSMCWSKKGDYVPMWSIYSFNDKAVMIETTEEKITSLENIGTHSSVEYVSDISLEKEIDKFIEVREKEEQWHVDQLFTTKRDAFKHEDEVRFFCKNNGSLDPNVPTKVSVNGIEDFIEGVTVHPKASEWYVETVKLYCKNRNINFIGKSKIYD